MITIAIFSIAAIIFITYFVVSYRPLKHDEKGFWFGDEHIPYEAVYDYDEDLQFGDAVPFWLQFLAPTERKTILFKHPRTGKNETKTISNKTKDYDIISKKVCNVILERKYGEEIL